MREERKAEEDARKWQKLRETERGRKLGRTPTKLRT
jgi:hypothetical protein